MQGHRRQHSGEGHRRQGSGDQDGKGKWLASGSAWFQQAKRRVAQAAKETTTALQARLEDIDSRLTKGASPAPEQCGPSSTVWGPDPTGSSLHALPCTAAWDLPSSCNLYKPALGLRARICRSGALLLPTGHKEHLTRLALSPGACRRPAAQPQRRLRCPSLLPPVGRAHHADAPRPGGQHHGGLGGA